MASQRTPLQASHHTKDNRKAHHKRINGKFSTQPLTGKGPPDSFWLGPAWHHDWGGSLRSPAPAVLPLCLPSSLSPLTPILLLISCFPPLSSTYLMAVPFLPVALPPQPSIPASPLPGLVPLGVSGAVGLTTCLCAADGTVTHLLVQW